MFKILKIDKTIVFAFAIEFSKDKKSGVWKFGFELSSQMKLVYVGC